MDNELVFDIPFVLLYTPPALSCFPSNPASRSSLSYYNVFLRYLELTRPLAIVLAQDTASWPFRLGHFQPPADAESFQRYLRRTIWSASG